MKAEIEIPTQLAEVVVEETSKSGVSADEIVETAIRYFLERSRTDAE